MGTQQAFQLSRSDRAELKRWLRRKGSRSGEALRARLLLVLDEGRAITDIAKTFHVSRPTVYQWKRRREESGSRGRRTEFT